MRASARHAMVLLALAACAALPAAAAGTPTVPLTPSASLSLPAPPNTTAATTTAAPNTTAVPVTAAPAVAPLIELAYMNNSVGSADLALRLAGAVGVNATRVDISGFTLAATNATASAATASFRLRATENETFAFQLTEQLAFVVAIGLNGSYPLSNGSVVLFNQHLLALNLTSFAWFLPTTAVPDTTGAAPTFTPVPTVRYNDAGNQSPAGEPGASDNTALIYAIVFGIIGAVIIISVITFCVKKFAMREKKNTSKGGGYRYAAKV
jgi:hypothetical protein